MIKDLSKTMWYIWRDDEDLIKFLKENTKKMKPKKLLEEVEDNFGIISSLQELGAVKSRHGIHHYSETKGKDKWKEGMDVDEAFKEST